MYTSILADWQHSGKQEMNKGLCRDKATLAYVGLKVPQFKYLLVYSVPYVSILQEAVHSMLLCKLWYLLLVPI